MVLLLVVLLFTPIGALLSSFVYSTLWAWFLAPQYGAGPSMAAWYGLATIANLVVNLRTAKVSDEAEADSVYDVIVKVIASWLVMFVSLAIAGGVGKILGWI